MPGASPLDTLTAVVGDLTVAVTTLSASSVALLPHRQPVRAACESLSTSLRTLQEIFTDPAILPLCGREQRVAPLLGPETSPAGTEPRVAPPLAVMPPPVERTVSPANPLELLEPSPSVTFSPTSALEQRVLTQPPYGTILPSPPRSRRGQVHNTHRDSNFVLSLLQQTLQSD
jgi:hypothetical protein